MMANQLFKQLVADAITMPDAMKQAKDLPWQEELKFYGGVLWYYFMFLPYPGWLK
jgi:hypothetical protein